MRASQLRPSTGQRVVARSSRLQQPGLFIHRDAPSPRGTVAFGACLEKKIVGEGILGRAPLDQFLFRGREHRLQLARDGLREFRLNCKDVREIFIVGLVPNRLVRARIVQRAGDADFLIHAADGARQHKRHPSSSAIALGVFFAPRYVIAGSRGTPRSSRIRRRFEITSTCMPSTKTALASWSALRFSNGRTTIDFGPRRGSAGAIGAGAPAFGSLALAATGAGDGADFRFVNPTNPATTIASAAAIPVQAGTDFPVARDFPPAPPTGWIRVLASPPLAARRLRHVSNPRLISPPSTEHFPVSSNRTIFREQET